MALRNLFGEIGLEATLQKIAQYLEQLASSLGRTYPDTNGRMRVNIETGTLSGVNAMGGYNAQYDQYCQMMNNANYIRSRITTS